MARPFRFRPPAVPPGIVARPRLASTMGTRWERRLVSVVAGPGFGKTVLLATAAATEAGSSARVDVWLTCEPADAEAEHLLAGLVVASGLPADGIADLSDRVWAQAPRLVCFLLDDVHEVPEGSDGARLLGRLLTELPGNGRLVLASREPVPVPVSRLAAAGQVTRITERDLVFDSDEATAFAEARALPPDRMAAAGGWPALVDPRRYEPAGRAPRPVDRRSPVSTGGRT